MCGGGRGTRPCGENRAGDASRPPARRLSHHTHLCPKHPVIRGPGRKEGTARPRAAAPRGCVCVCRLHSARAHVPGRLPLAEGGARGGRRHALPKAGSYKNHRPTEWWTSGGTCRACQKLAERDGNMVTDYETERGRKPVSHRHMPGRRAARALCACKGWRARYFRKDSLLGLLSAGQEGCLVM